MKDANLKIPVALFHEYSLSSTAIFLYSELNGLYSKFHKCEITDATLSKRLNRSIASIQRGLNELKKAQLITSKQKPNYKGRRINVSSLDARKFLTIPIQVIKNKNLSLEALLVYGSLYARQNKLIKINKDKHQENAPLIITVTKSDLAKELNKSPRSIQYQLKKLRHKNYIEVTYVTGINLEIMLNPVVNLVENSQKGQKVTVNPSKKREATPAKSEKPPQQKVRSHPSKKRATNKVFNRVSNKGEDFSSSLNKDQREDISDTSNIFETGKPLTKPIYYDSIPNENDMPPLQENESIKDIVELNQLDHNSNQHKNITRTVKSGLGGMAKKKQVEHHSTKHKNNNAAANSPLCPDTTNKPDTETTQQTNKHLPTDSNKGQHLQIKQKSYYVAYDGFNLDYQCNTLQEILRRRTNKKYIITARTKPLIEQQLKDNFDLNDFEAAINYLIQHKKAISIKDLATHLPDYLSKINCN